MIPSQVNHKSRLLTLLKGFAPPSVVDRGLFLADQGHVNESSKSGNKLYGVIRGDDEVTYHISIDISGREIGAQCTCCSASEMQEQWCSHAVAVVWRAHDLGFFDADGGFAATESTFRMNTSSPQEIASVISELNTNEAAVGILNVYTPTVAIAVHLDSDRLGVQVFFDGEQRVPGLFASFGSLSSRALDNLLLQALEEHGSWDEDHRLWYVNSSAGIETVFGLIQEYDDVVVADTKNALRFERNLLAARLIVNWLPTGAELGMDWVLPGGEIHEKKRELLGTGPYWTFIDGTIYRLSPAAARIAAIFPHSPSITLTRSQLAPILEALGDGVFDTAHIVIVHPELQPKAQIKTPVPVLSFEARDIHAEHFDSNQNYELYAALQFEYPVAPESKNIVFLPDRAKEREFSDHLKSLGFEYLSHRRRYVISGDSALDLVHSGGASFDHSWRLEGLDIIRKNLRFADLSINLTVSANNETRANERGSNSDWFDCHISLVRNNANIPISTIFKTVRADSDRWIRLDNGSFARVPGGSLNYLKTTLGMLDPNFRLSNTIKSKLSMAQAIGLSRVEDSGFNVSIDTKLIELGEKFRNFKSIASVKVSKQFDGKLRSYQTEGVSWLHFLHEFELGGILADEMGLGKTVQALAFLQYLKDRRGKKSGLDKPALIVAPTSVITNWCYEARRFTPKLKVLLLHGAQRKLSFAEIAQHDLVITSYALLRLDRYDLEKYEFSYCILDEAQNIKNSQAATTKAAKSIRARHRLALSGTPTENRPMELWSIMDFLMPGYLGSNDFFRNFIEKPILEGGPGVQVAKFLNAKTRPFILRRTKAEVERDLPPKIESVIHVEMTPSQQQLYMQVLEEVRPKVFDAVRKKGIRGASISILAALLRLRQICNHPSSIDALRELPGLDSGKFNLLKDLLSEALENGRKIILFSQFIEMLSIIRRWVEEQKAPYLYLDGATKDRQTLIDQFNNDEKYRLFLISLKAGGTGLNLTAADTVVIYDPWWNPAVESQAVDRAHRIGQTKTVTVYRLVTEESVEQKIMALKEKKSKIVDALINENGLSTLTLSKGDLESLFSPFPASDATAANPGITSGRQ